MHIVSAKLRVQKKAHTCRRSLQRHTSCLHRYLFEKHLNLTRTAGSSSPALSNTHFSHSNTRARAPCCCHRIPLHESPPRPSNILIFPITFLSQRPSSPTDSRRNAHRLVQTSAVETNDTSRDKHWQFSLILTSRRRLLRSVLSTRFFVLATYVWPIRCRPPAVQRKCYFRIPTSFRPRR